MQIPILKPGDVVEIIAPASRCSDDQLASMQEVLTEWGLRPIISEDIFAQDILCANTDKQRLALLIKALENDQSKAIICARGGYGCMRLIPALPEPGFAQSPKLFLGMSDITALNLYFMQKWGWSVIHGSFAPRKFSAQSTQQVKNILFGLSSQIEFKAKPLNDLAAASNCIMTSITGGNLCLLQTSIGTPWQIDCDDKILLLEEIGERGYKVDRMLEQLHQSEVLKRARAILFGDFIKGEEPDGSDLTQVVIQRFAENISIPVMQTSEIGHGFHNMPIPLGTPAQVEFGESIRISCAR